MATDENTIFTGQASPPSATPMPQPAMSQPITQPAPPPPSPQPEPGQKDAASLVTNDYGESRFSFLSGNRIKIIVGIIIVILVGFLFMRFLLPLFFGNKEERVTLTYWGLWEDANVMQSIINDFQREHPNIQVSYEKQDVREYRERLLARMENGTGPDIFRYHNTWLPQLSDVLSPLPQSVISKNEFQKSFYPIVQEDLTKNGALYGLPLNIDTLALFINVDAFQAASLQPPTTWENFAKAARTLTVKDETTKKIKTAGAALGTYSNITHAPDIISLLLVQNGANLKSLDATQQNVTDALDFYTSFAVDEENVWDESLDPSRLAFAKGTLVMYFGYSWDIFIIKAINPNLSFQIVPVPKLPGREMTIASYWVEGVSVKSKYQKQGFTFMQYLARRETEQKLYTEIAKTRLFGPPYARSDLASFLKDNPLIFPFVSQAPQAVSSYFASDTYDNGLNKEMNTYLENAVTSIVRGTSPQTASETLVQGAAQVLGKYGQK